MEFKPRNFGRWNEQDVREDVIAPLLKRLGYEKDTENDILRGEQLRLKYYKEVLGRLKKDDKPLNKSGIPDYILEVDGKKRWVIEAKGPAESITEENVWQAYSYAKHPEVRAVFFCLCNGRELQIFRTDHLPESALVKSIKYEDFEKEFDTISNILSPDAVRRNWPDIEIDTGKPLGPGLRSFAQITGGTFSYSFTSIQHPLLQELLFTITGGSIGRTDDGKLIALITTRSPLASAQKVAEQVGLDLMRLTSDDEVISSDPNNPTVLSSKEPFAIPAGSVVLGYRYPQTMRGRTETIAKGHLFEGTVKGRFEAVMRFDAFAGINAVLRGSFEAQIV